MSETANTPQESAWFAYTEDPYYRLVRQLLIDHKFPISPDLADLTIENIWKAGFIAGEFAKAQE